MKTILLLILLSMTNLTLAQDSSNDAEARPGFPQGYIYGSGVAFQQQIYKGYDQRTIAIPLLGYAGEKFNVFGPFISYSLVRNQNWDFDLNLSPRFKGFDEDDSDFFQGLEERKDSLDAGFTAKYKQNQWSYQFKALADVLSRSSGSDLEVNMARKFKINALTIEPSIAINQLDQNMTDYYYGLPSEEATTSRNFYKGSSTINKSLKLSISHPIPIGLLRLDLKNTWYGSGIAGSPLVDDDKAFGARLFFIGVF